MPTDKFELREPEAFTPARRDELRYGPLWTLGFGSRYLFMDSTDRFGATHSGLRTSLMSCSPRL